MATTDATDRVVVLATRVPVTKNNEAADALAAAVRDLATDQVSCFSSYSLEEAARRLGGMWASGT